MSEMIAGGLLQPDPLGPGTAQGGAAGYLLDAVRLRPTGRRVLSAISVLLVAAGVVTFSYPFFTDVYSAQLVQVPLADQFESPEIVEAYSSRTISAGEPLTRILMPTLDVDTMVVEGTSPSALRAGAGHYPNSPLPGEQGNVAIAGHRTTYGRPFSELDRLQIGDEITLVTPIEVHTYTVVPAPADSARPCPTGACWIVPPTEWQVVSATPTPMLTLTTCHPKGSSNERLIIRAELVRTEPRTFDLDGLPVPVSPTTAPSPDDPSPAPGPTAAPLPGEQPAGTTGDSS